MRSHIKFKLDFRNWRRALALPLYAFRLEFECTPTADVAGSIQRFMKLSRRNLILIDVELCETGIIEIYGK